MKEVHKEKFDDEADRWAQAKGYLIIFAVNMLSVVALAIYATGAIDSRQELWLEAVFLVTKGGVEIVTGKFSWELLLHHSAMVGGLIFNQHPSMRCWAFITVHQQLVHAPFAVRAIWRLTLPAMGYIQTETSWRRRGLANSFWMMWMFIVGYRTPLIAWYCLWAMYRLQWYWQPGVGFLMALILGSLDLGWTRAMWPKPGQGPPNQPKWHAVWFAVGTRLFFLLGFLFSIQLALSDVESEVLPAFLRLPMVPGVAPAKGSWGVTGRGPTVECLKHWGSI